LARQVPAQSDAFARHGCLACQKMVVEYGAALNLDLARPACSNHSSHVVRLRKVSTKCSSSWLSRSASFVIDGYGTGCL
jgi:hypothetical protein